MTKKNYTSSRILLGIYALAICVGAFLLFLPFSTVPGKSTTFLDALFTATSALTVTGLVVVDTASHWSFAGQMIILFLMQVGGLGLMVISTFVLMMLGLKINLGQRILISQDFNHFGFSGMVYLVRNVVLITLLVEVIAGVLLALALPQIWSEGVGKGVFFIAFHAISAFNGAGFDLTGSSMAPFRGNVLLNITMAGTVLLGSLGYVVLQEIFLLKRWRQLSLHSKLVIVVTGILTIFGVSTYLLLEFNANLINLSGLEKISESFFQVTMRTAGFSLFDINLWHPAFLFLMIGLMFIGASPGSVGGGIKTTTFATIFLSSIAYLRGQREAVIFSREIRNNSVVKAFTVLLSGLFLVFISTFLLLITEPFVFYKIFFEVVSALATVGLSMGITADLTPFGKMILIFLMFIGRIGIISLAIFFRAKDHRAYRYIKEDILIG